MTDGADWLAGLGEQLPRQAAIIGALRDAVESADRWSWLLVSCSLGAGRGDALSDIDAGIGHGEALAADDLERAGAELIAQVGELVDLLVHQLPGWKEGSLRFAAEYASGIQLDLVIFPAGWRKGHLAGEEVVVVDKDGIVADEITSSQHGPPTAAQAREWMMLGCWDGSST